MTIEITKANEKGSRLYQEDRFLQFEEDNGTMVLVADGHGGSDTADYVATKFKTIWQQSQLSPLSPAARFVKVFEQLHQLTKGYHAGSAVSAAYLDSDNIHVAILGDAPVVLQSEDNLWIGPEHNVRTNDAERKAAEERGGYYSGGYICKSFNGPGLQMSRALGDSALNSILLRQPEVFTLPKPSKGFLLVATDGVFDPGHSNPESAIKDAMNALGPDATAKDFVDRAIDEDTGDNATAILVRFA
jgi:serine/threonine protein phosphatase PrpC